MYGINRDSILNELSYFHVCDGALFPDIVHDLLESTLQYEVKLMLQVMINEEDYFTLDHLNTRIENVDLGYMEVNNRTTTVADHTLHARKSPSLKQNCMWCQIGQKAK